MKQTALLSRIKTSDLMAEMFSRRVLRAHACDVPDNGIVVIHYDPKYVDGARADFIANKLANAINRRPGKQVIFLFVPNDREFTVESLTEDEMAKFGWVRKPGDNEKQA